MDFVAIVRADHRVASIRRCVIIIAADVQVHDHNKCKVTFVAFVDGDTLSVADFRVTAVNSWRNQHQHLLSTSIKL